MKLYITSLPEQARNAMALYKGQTVNYITDNMAIKGILRKDTRKDQWYVKTKNEKINIGPNDVQMIVDDNKGVRIITNL